MQQRCMGFLHKLPYQHVIRNYRHFPLIKMSRYCVTILLVKSHWYQSIHSSSTHIASLENNVQSVAILVIIWLNKTHWGTNIRPQWSFVVLRPMNRNILTYHIPVVFNIHGTHMVNVVIYALNEQYIVMRNMSTKCCSYRYNIKEYKNENFQDKNAY